jgi:hypothetical protein
MKTISIITAAIACAPLITAAYAQEKTEGYNTRPSTATSGSLYDYRDIAHNVETLSGAAWASTVLAQETQPSRVAAASGEIRQTPSVEDIAKLKQNPVSGLRQIGFQAAISPNLPDSSKTLGGYSIQPVWPFPVNEDWRLITYTILPVLQVPGRPGEDTTVGLGDTLLNFYFTPKTPGKIVWGAGPAIQLPTHTDPLLGSNRLGLGPSGILFYAEEKWSAGVVLQNVWSVGGSDSQKFNSFSAQYFLNYNLPEGWFMLSNASITADWRKTSRDRWTVPVGGGFGKFFKIGNQPVSLSAQAFYNAVTPRNGPDFTAIVQFSLLFP